MFFGKSFSQVANIAKDALSVGVFAATISIGPTVLGCALAGVPLAYGILGVAGYFSYHKAIELWNQSNQSAEQDSCYDHTSHEGNINEDNVDVAGDGLHYSNDFEGS